MTTSNITDRKGKRISTDDIIIRVGVSRGRYILDKIYKVIRCEVYNGFKYPCVMDEYGERSKITLGKMWVIKPDSGRYI